MEMHRFRRKAVLSTFRHWKPLRFPKMKAVHLGVQLVKWLLSSCLAFLVTSQYSSGMCSEAALMEPSCWISDWWCKATDLSISLVHHSNGACNTSVHWQMHKTGCKAWMNLSAMHLKGRQFKKLAGVSQADGSVSLICKLQHRMLWMVLLTFL